MSPDEKRLVANRETRVKQEFREQLGLIVDQRRDGGAGTTTTGNVARKAFQNPALLSIWRNSNLDICIFLPIFFTFLEIVARICDVPVKLVENLGTLWSALASGYAIDPDKFGVLCEETEKIYFDHVKWYWLSPTIHKVLKHGKQIIEACVLPIGMTNEEPGEANNKFLRKIRLYHARKSSWLNGMSDLFLRLMDISDPKIQAYVHCKKKKHNSEILPEPIKKLLKMPELQISRDASDLEEE
ncbi:uncharacterized protein LOC136094512 [Hydra vulgaris]|uniref:uncharacterized protein LOC136094512 n=1 Tax=Hydra vulgaris TaxID=6087 RepID=UPI0032EA32EC